MTKPRILVVEDEAITAMALKSTLVSMGYDVPATVATGDEAIARARELRPDAVLMDIRLKGAMDGITAADTIRRELGSPVVYLTAYSDPDTLRRARVTEPYGYIVKPYNEKELRAIVEIAVHKGAMERARREGADEVAARMLQGILDANPAPIYLTHADGRLMLVNKRFEELYGIRRDALATARVPPALAEADARALAAGDVAGAKDALRLPLQRADGTTYGLCTILTTPARASEALAPLSRELERRAPEPSRPAGGAAEALAASHAEMSSEARALSGTVKRLLGSLFNAGRAWAAEADEVDITALARGVAWQVASAMRVPEPDIVIEEGLRARGDPVLLKVVLENLVRNALSFPVQGRRPRVHITRHASREGDLVLAVRDNGKGFEPHAAERIFEPFARSDSPEVGLALSAVRNLVEGHGGRAWAEPHADGATFYVSLPSE